ncbi:hypothetical protein [Spirillospora sp. NPDC029432]|uniref:hypothetical protein n=1 Tax=Spirillospora sp. NPDC029432 TaxID=3154599 RepID=UPI00345377F6
MGQNAGIAGWKGLSVGIWLLHRIGLLGLWLMRKLLYGWRRPPKPRDPRDEPAERDDL